MDNLVNARCRWCPIKSSPRIHVSPTRRPTRFLLCIRKRRNRLESRNPRKSLEQGIQRSNSHSTLSLDMAKIVDHRIPQFIILHTRPTPPKSPYLSRHPSHSPPRKTPYPLLPSFQYILNPQSNLARIANIEITTSLGT